MISNQIMQNTIEGIKAIARVDLFVADVDGKLVASTKKDLKIKKIITVAGNLDHLAWIQYHNLPSLSESMNLVDYKNEYFKIPQKHFVGNKDSVIPPKLNFDFLGENNIDVEVVDEASHSTGWDSIYYKIWSEN